MRERIPTLRALALVAGILTGLPGIPARAAISASAQTPAESAAAREAKAKKQREELARQEQARKDQAQKDQAEKDRIARERAQPETEKARLESDRKRIAAERAAPPPKLKQTPETARQEREVAKKAAHFEQMYRSRLARTNRLIRIYKAKGDQAKVAHLEELRTKLEKRNTNAKEGFRKQISAENWDRMNAELRKQHTKTDKDIKRLENAEGSKKGGSL